MKIEKHGDKYRAVKTINKKKYYVTFDHMPKKSEVEEALAELISGRVTAQNAPRQTFGTCVDDYIELKRNVLSPASVKKYMDLKKTIPEWFLELEMKEVDQIAVQKLINDYSSSYAPKTVRNLHGFIAGVIAVYMPSVALNTTLPQRIKDERHIPSREDVKAVLEASRDSRYYIVFRLACYGLRRSEIAALKYPDDFDGNIIHISKADVINEDGDHVIKTTKTVESTRDIAIDDELRELIEKQGYIYNGHFSRVNAALDKYQEQLGIEHFRLHDFRAYFATELSQSGLVSEADILRLGGWSSDYTMKRVYRHSRIQQDREAQKQASDIIFGTIS